MAEFASKGVAGSGLGLGIAGTALGVLNALGTNGNGGLVGILGGGGNYASKAELGMAQDLAAKDARIGLLESQVYVDQKIVEAYTALDGKINGLAGEVRANKEAQNAINMNQAVYNGANTATISCLQAQVNELLALTKRVVPNGSVCPGWGKVTVAPAGSDTT